MPVTRPQTYTQKTKDALAYFLGGAQAATLCNIRSAGRSASKEELVAAYNCLFDALTPVLEASNDEEKTGKRGCQKEALQKSGVPFGRKITETASNLG